MSEIKIKIDSRVFSNLILLYVTSDQHPFEIFMYHHKKLNKQS